MRIMTGQVGVAASSVMPRSTRRSLPPAPIARSAVALCASFAFAGCILLDTAYERSDPSYQAAKAEKQGDFRQADVYLGQTQRELESKGYGDSPAMAETLIVKGGNEGLEQRYSQAEKDIQQGLQMATKSSDFSKQRVLSEALQQRATLRLAEGRLSDAEADARRALDIELGGLGGVQQFQPLQLRIASEATLLQVLLTEGKIEEAQHQIDVAGQQVQTLAAEGPRKEALNGLLLVGRAVIASDQGHYEEADRLAHQVLSSPQTLSPAQTSLVLSMLASVYESEGRYAEAEPIEERMVEQAERSPAFQQTNITGALSMLAENASHNNKPAEAEQALRRELAIDQAEWGADSAPVGTVLLRLSNFYIGRGRYADAESLERQSLQIEQRLFGANSASAGNALLLLGKSEAAQGRFADGERDLKKARETVTAAGPAAVAQADIALGSAFRSQRRFAEAEASYRDALGATGNSGLAASEQAETLGMLGAALADDQKYEEARKTYENERRLLYEMRKDNAGLDDQSLRDLLRRGDDDLRNYAELLGTISTSAKSDNGAGLAASDAFVVAEQLRGGSTQMALARAAARVTAADPVTGQLFERTQDLRDQRQALWRQMSESYLKLGENPSEQKSFASLQDTERALDAQLKSANEELGRSFPRYRELTAPDPIDVAGVQDLLRPTEALLSMMVLPDRTLLWLIRPAAAPVRFQQLQMGSAEATSRARHLRESLKPDRPYDVADAYFFCRQLVAPFEQDLIGVKNLILVPDDTLLSVPFAALVTSDQGDAYHVLAEHYAQGQPPSQDQLKRIYPRIEWLVRKDFSISELPSATSLRLLRGAARPTTETSATEPFIGIGDPLLQGGGDTRGGSIVAIRGGAEVDDIRNLPRLPGTRDELLADAHALGADPSSALFMEEHATKPQVMALNHDRLGRAEVIAFATHALIGGEFGSLAEPALVLTPPAQPSADDDGLLTIDDVLGLRLSSNRWLILSACNTAAPDKSGEGFSGLTRAFFYAGAPSLLVSQWSVDDAATDQLMTDMFASYGKGTDASHSAALRDAMLKLMNAGETDPAHAYFAHPFAWAPFIVVGEGGTVAR